MAMTRLLSSILTLAAVSGASAKCASCTVSMDDYPLGFLHPARCCPDMVESVTLDSLDNMDFPFTFLANFSAGQSIVTFHLHEYYLPDTEVRICRSIFFDIYDEYYYYSADDYAIEKNCADDYPFRCLSEKTVSLLDLSFRSWNIDGILNITIPLKPRPVLETHGPYGKRPIFNITYEWRRVGEPDTIADRASIANLDMCNFNGYPVLTPITSNTTNYVFKCQCVGDANGSRCEWGGDCHAHSPTTPCNSHGECRYYRGSVKCTCDEEHFGYRCEYPISSGQPLQAAVCKAMGVNCSHLCSLARQPHCLCPPHLLLHNETHCVPRAQLVDVTVQLLDTDNSTFSTHQAKNLLKEACITVVNTSYHNDSKEFRFAMNKYWKNCFPRKSEWEAALNANVTFRILEQEFIWVGPLNMSMQEDKLVLQSTLYTSTFPVNVSFFIGQHQIYSFEVDSCGGRFSGEVITVIIEEDENTKGTVGNPCSYNAICTKNALCTITFLADRYDPDLDWGKFSVEVSQGNASSRQSVVVDADPRLLVTMHPASAYVNKNGNITLTCSLMGNWKWSDDSKIQWIFPKDKAVFEVETPAWNVSYLYIKHIKQSISVSCEASVWSFCEDRRSRNSKCVGRGCEPNVVVIHCLEPEALRCSGQSDASITWHTTPVNATSYSNCPEEFEGISKRHCKLSQNGTAVWDEPDYGFCVYRPFRHLLQRPVMRYLKRGYHVDVDSNDTIAEIWHMFKARRSMLLPGELFFIQDQLKQFLRPNVIPIDPSVFLRFIKEMREKIPVNDRWQLLRLVRSYLKQDTRLTAHAKFDDLLMWIQDVPSEWKYFEGENNKSLTLKVASQLEAQRVGAFVFLEPRNIPTTELRRNQSVEYNLSGPVVEVVVVDVSNRFPLKNVTLNMSFYDPDMTINRTVCGGAKASETLGETLEWDLSQCTTLSHEEEGDKATLCYCQGPGLFAFFRRSELVPTDTD